MDKQIEHNEARRLERQPESASSLRILTSPYAVGFRIPNAERGTVVRHVEDIHDGAEVVRLADGVPFDVKREHLRELTQTERDELFAEERARA